MSIKYRLDNVTILEFDGRTVLSASGWCIDDHGELPAIILRINGNITDFDYTMLQRYDIMRKYNLPDSQLSCGFRIQNNNAEKINTLQIDAYTGTEHVEILNKKHSQLRASIVHKPILYAIDTAMIDEKHLTGFISGWTFSYDHNEIEYEIKNKIKSEVPFQFKRILRRDLYQANIVGYENATCGFQIRFKVNSTDDDNYYFVIKAGQSIEQLSFKKLILEQRMDFKSRLKRITLKSIPNAINIIREYGFVRILENVKLRNPKNSYHQWFLRHRVTKEELEKQRSMKLPYQPKISILVPTYNTPIKLLVEMIESVRNQSYSNWELCIADGSTPSNEARSIIRNYAMKDPRIRVDYLTKNYGISGNTNKALEIATGEYTALFDHDDLLEADALFEAVKLMQNENVDVIYTDEDKLNEKTHQFEEPNFKPDYAPDQLCSNNYITHFFITKTAIIKGIGGFRSAYDGSQDYDVIFRCIEQAETVFHIPKILYHWRIHEGSTAADPSAKLYCYEAGKAAIQSHLNRIGVKGSVTMMLDGWWGLYHTRYATEKKPLVSIVIINEESIDNLRKCINSLEMINTYSNIEIIIVNLRAKLTHTDYEDLRRNERIRIVEFKEETINISRAENYGASFANGEYILFLNSTIEVIEPDSISEMLGMCMRNDTGVVGAKLLYEDDTVEHAGIVIGLGGSASYVMRGIPNESPGYQMRAIVPCNYSAVSGACMMTKKSLLDQLGGFDANYGLQWQDVDYCLRVREKNLLVAYNAFAQFYHHIPKNVNEELSGSDLQQIAEDTIIFTKRWKEMIENGDPYYNPNFYLNDRPID